MTSHIVAFVFVFLFGLDGNRSNALRLWQDPKASLLMVRDGYAASGMVVAVCSCDTEAAAACSHLAPSVLTIRY